MSVIGSAVACQRVRMQVSLQLDDELSQLERRMLDAHLGRCSECRAYAADLTTFTHQLRSAPLEPLRRPVVITRRRRLGIARVQAGLAAAIAIVAVGVASQTTQWGRADTTQSSFDTVTQFPTRTELDRELAIFESLPARRTVSLGSTFS